MTTSKEHEFNVGRRSQDGTIRLSVNLPQMLTLSVSHKGERAASVLLTREQVKQLQQALAELEPLIEAERTSADRWDGGERRALFPS